MKFLRVALLVGLVVCRLAFEKRASQGRIESNLSLQQAGQGAEDQNSTSPKEGRIETQPQDFTARCHAAGVVVCQGFDSPLINIAARWPAAGLYPGGDNMIHGKFDREEKASGEGSLRFKILGHTGHNAAGFWRDPFCRDFGPVAPVYLQVRERLALMI